MNPRLLHRLTSFSIRSPPRLGARIPGASPPPSGLIHAYAVSSAPRRAAALRAVEHGEAAQTALQVILEGPASELGDLACGCPRRLSQGLSQTTAQDASQERQRLGRDRHAAAAGTAQGPTLADVEGNQLGLRPARGALVEHRM